MFSAITSMHYGKCGISEQTLGCILDFGFTQLSFIFTLQALQVGIIGKLIKGLKT